MELGKNRLDSGRRLRERLGPSSVFIWRSWVLTPAFGREDSASPPRRVGLPRLEQFARAELGSGRGGEALLLGWSPPP